MSIFHAIVLAIVEGITEFLPVSSTGHMILVSHALGISETEFVKSFEIIIQLGAILAVVIIYWRTLLTKKHLWLPLLVAFIPTGIIGLLLYKVVKNVLLGNTTITLISLLVGGVILLFIDRLKPEKQATIDTIEHISLKQAFIIGLIQSISIIPGVSRAAATIVGGIFVGAKRSVAVEFSFLLAIPTMAAATGLDLVKSGNHFTGSEYVVLSVGFVVAFLVAIAAVKTFLRFVQTHNFVPFGIYRVVLTVLYWAFVR